MNEEDRLLEDLGARWRAQSAADDELLARVASNQLTKAEQETLERRAASDPELFAQLELHRPIELESVYRSADRHASSPPRRKATGRKRWLVYGSPLLAAAALLLFLGTRQLPPVYEVEVHGAVSPTREPNKALGELRIEDVEPSFVLRPRSRLDHPMAARVFVRSEHPTEPTRPWQDWPQEMESAEGGSVRVTLKGIATLPTAGRLGICVFDPARGRLDAASFADDERCVRLDLAFVTPGKR